MLLLCKIIIILFFLFLFYIIVPSIIKIILRRNFLSSISDKGVYLTFDDGPDPQSTPHIIKILDKYNVKATFFVTGENLEKHPRIVKEIIEQNHCLGIHGYRHLHAWKTDPFRIIIDFYKFFKVCKDNDISNQYFKLYRPPYGKLNLINLFFIILFNKKIIFWDIDPQDYKIFSSELVAGHVLDKLMVGKVVLLHDGRSGADKTPVSVTMNALEPIISEAKKRELKWCLFVC